MISKLSKLRPLVLAWAALAAVLVAGCGGGERVTRFVPTRVLSFGDENSVIVDASNNANGLKYTINTTVSATDATIACSSAPIWNQYLAAAYGLRFAQCNPNAVATPSRIYAANGATSIDVATQIDQHLSVDSFSTTDLVTVLAGANDVLAQYAQYPTLSEAEMGANLDAAGITLAAQVNRIANLGGKVILATAPDMGLTPYAVAENTAHTDTDRAALLTRLTAHFNNKLRANIMNDGRLIGLLLLDETIQTLVKFPDSFGYTNVTSAACNPTLAPQVLACTSLTLVTGATSVTYLWADDRHLSSSGHDRLGQLAVSRAVNNPF